MFKLKYLLLLFIVIIFVFFINFAQIYLFICLSVNVIFILIPNNWYVILIYRMYNIYLYICVLFYFILFLFCMLYKMKKLIQIFKQQFVKNGGLAQLEERVVRNVEAPGSKPGFSNIFCFFFFLFSFIWFLFNFLLQFIV